MKQRSLWIFNSIVVLLLAAVISCAPAATPSAVPAAPSANPATPPAAPNVPASPPASPGRGDMGQRISGPIANITANSVTVGTVTVNIATGTTVQKTVQGTVADLQTGQFLAVTGTTDASGIVTATSIIVRQQRQGMPQNQPSRTPRASRTPPATGANPSPRNPTGVPGRGNGGGTAGILNKIDGNTLTLTAGQSTVTVVVNSATVIQKTIAGTIADLHVGDSVSIFASRDTSGNQTATSISIVPPGQANPPASPD